METGDKKNVFERKYVYGCGKKLDVKAMRQAAEFLIGEHDFKSFCSVNAQVESTVRTIYSCEVQREGTELVIRISGGGFLYNMVRIMVGTLLRVAQGKFQPEDIPHILEAKNRKMAGPTAPPCGLYLNRVFY